MKIAIISFGFWGSTIPLAKALSKSGHEVDYYIEVFGKHICTLESTDIENVKVSGLYGCLKRKELGYVRDYAPKVPFYYFRIFQPGISRPYLRPLSNLANRILCKYLSREINDRMYDGVILVGHYDLDHFVFFHKYIHTKILTCLHEVCNHMNPDYSQRSALLSYMFKHNRTIVVHSDNCLNDILKYEGSNNQYIRKIPFGLFELWSLHTGDASLERSLPSDYMLFIGGISHYKGLDVLSKAIEIVNQKRKVAFVIAGRGYVNAIEDLKAYENVTIINRMVSNAEYVSLVRNAKCIICPYRTMSQSGIPQSVWALGKPLIVSSLKGFEEVVVDGKTGIFFETENANALAEAICSIYDDSELYKEMVSSVSNINTISPSLDWQNIASAYIELFS